MMAFLLVVIFAASILSLASYLYCWQDIRHGRPHIISLRQITGIMDREQLNVLFGQPQGGFRYQLSPPMLQAVLERRSGFFYGECATDAVCALAAWGYLVGEDNPLMVKYFILLAGLCQGINFAYSTWLVRRWAHQIREEIDKE